MMITRSCYIMNLKNKTTFTLLGDFKPHCLLNFSDGLSRLLALFKSFAFLVSPSYILSLLYVDYYRTNDMKGPVPPVYCWKHNLKMQTPIPDT